MISSIYRLAILSTLTVGSLSAFAEDSSVLSSGVTAGSQLSAQMPEDAYSGVKGSKLTLTTTVIGKSMEDRYVNSKWGGGILDVVGERVFNDELSAKLDLTFNLAAGSFSNQYGSEGAAPLGLQLNAAFMTYKPLEAFSLELGVLVTEFSSLPSTFEANGFPGARETVTLKGDLLKASVFAMQAIPTSSTAAVQPSENGITTQVHMAGVGVTSNPDDKENLTLLAGVTAYRFRDLNTSAATDSQYLGNSVVTVGSQARFKYEFAGTETGAAVTYKFTPSTNFKLSGALIRNDQAPDGLNRGYLYAGTLVTPAGRNKLLTTSLGYFYNEGDTLPGSYAAVGKGFNNRFGNTFSIKWSNEKNKTAGYVKYARANEIDDKPYTADREIVTIGLEAAYDIL